MGRMGESYPGRGARPRRTRNRASSVTPRREPPRDGCWRGRGARGGHCSRLCGGRERGRDRGGEGRRGRTPARVDGREGQGAPRGASGGVCRRAGARQRPVHVGVELRERDRTGTVSGVYYENITNSCRRATSSVSVWPPGQATTPRPGSHRLARPAERRLARRRIAMSTAAAFAVVPARPAVVRRRARDLRTRAGHVSRNGPNDASVRGDDDAATGRRGFISSVAAVTFAAAGVLDAARAPEARAFGCVPLRSRAIPRGHSEMPTGSIESRANPVPVD